MDTEDQAASLLIVCWSPLETSPILVIPEYDFSGQAGHLFVDMWSFLNPQLWHWPKWIKYTPTERQLKGLTGIFHSLL